MLSRQAFRRPGLTEQVHGRAPFLLGCRRGGIGRHKRVKAAFLALGARMAPRRAWRGLGLANVHSVLVAIDLDPS